MRQGRATTAIHPEAAGRRYRSSAAVLLAALVAALSWGTDAQAREKAAKTALTTKAPAAAPATRGPEAGDIPDPRTILPPPEVEMDVVRLLAGFPREERPYIQQVVHTVKDLGLLNKQCAKKASLYWQKGVPKVSSAQELDLADVSRFNQGYLQYFDPLRTYLRLSYRRLYGIKPPSRFEKAHKYWLGYLAYALENLDHQRSGGKDPNTRPSHSPVEVTQYRAWAYRLFKENGLDLTPYLVP
ncbi:MAG TPA: hypothetical protein V6D08_09315 [Candidatus Obscuribacterales bacterium]